MMSAYLASGLAAEHAVVPHQVADLAAGLVVAVGTRQVVGRAHRFDDRVVAKRQPMPHRADAAVDAHLSSRSGPAKADRAAPRASGRRSPGRRPPPRRKDR